MVQSHPLCSMDTHHCWMPCTLLALNISLVRVSEYSTGIPQSGHLEAEWNGGMGRGMVRGTAKVSVY